jgi:hypothetical protein
MHSVSLLLLPHVAHLALTLYSDIPHIGLSLFVVSVEVFVEILKFVVAHLVGEEGGTYLRSSTVTAGEDFFDAGQTEIVLP